VREQQRAHGRAFIMILPRPAATVDALVRAFEPALDRCLTLVEEQAR
jgi:hypothetical protein